MTTGRACAPAAQAVNQPTSGRYPLCLLSRNSEDDPEREGGERDAVHQRLMILALLGARM